MDLERFDKREETTEFFCILCQSISVMPLQHNHCNRTYCSECIRSMIRQGVDCPGCFGSRRRLDLADIVPLDIENGNTYNQLKFTCNFCEELIKMEFYAEHANQCCAWPNELVVRTNKSKSTFVYPPNLSTNLISDPTNGPITSDRKIFRLVQLYQDGNKINHGTRRHVYFNKAATTNELYRQAAILADQHVDEIVLIYSTHQLLERDQKLSNVLPHTYSSVNITNRETHELYQHLRMPIIAPPKLPMLP